MLNRHEIYVDGAWTRSDGTESVAVIDPTTEEHLGDVVIATEADVDRAVASADRALRAGPWASSDPQERRAVVLGIRDALLARADELADLATRTLGQLRGEAQTLGHVAALIDMYVDAFDSIELEYLRRDAAGTSLITRRPVGVVAGITPWNTPLRSEVKKTIPALLAGCTVVLKSAPETPYAGGVLAEAATAAGAPPGVVNAVSGGGTVGRALVRHPAVRKVAFTGSTATGADIGAECGRTFTRMQLELGGKSAAVVLPDADLEAALPHLARGNFYATGQMCVALSRVLVHESIYDKVLEGLVERARAHVVGNPFDPATTLGPLVSSRQRERVLGYVQIARAEGARIVHGGGRPVGLDRGWFVEPTVLAGVDNSMRIAREETFGPIASVIAFRDENEAVAIANDSPYGLHGAVFAGDDEHALAVARRIDTGSLGVNTFGTTTSAPFGGVRNSGVGREHGPEGFDAFLEYVPYTVSESFAGRYAAARRPVATEAGR